MIKVYGASLMSAAPEWLRLREEWSEVHWTALWPLLAGSVPEAPSFAKIFWQRDMEDVAKADVVMVLAPDEEDVNRANGRGFLRGALVEAGAGLALGKAVLLVGDCWEFGTWQYHPRCFKVEDLLEAREMLRLLALAEVKTENNLRIRMPQDYQFQNPNIQLCSNKHPWTP